MTAPDFDNVKVEEVELPYDASKKFLKATFEDEMLQGYQVIVIEDSFSSHKVSPGEQRLTTVVARYPRYVHSELLTHRVFSRNSASSRARSVKKTFREVIEDPVIPLFTINQRGMKGKYSPASHRELQVKEWLLARNDALANAMSLLIGPAIWEKGWTSEQICENFEQLLDDYYENGYDADGDIKNGLSTHKQQANRVIEPFLWHETLITSSFWENFLNLRNHDDAQPEIHAVAALMDALLEESDAVTRSLHLPFIPEADRPSELRTFEEIEDILLLSSTECAQISYNDKATQKKSTATLQLGKRLLEAGHLSPFEHVAIDRQSYYFIKSITERELPSGAMKLMSNFDDNWVQLRPVLIGGLTR